MMKKCLTLAVALILAIAPVAPVYAHGGHHGRNSARNQAVRYAVCQAEDCLLIGLHAHGSRTYAAHYYGDGHDYHVYCEIADCILSGYHSHEVEIDGANTVVYCFGHTAFDGHGYHHVVNHY